VGQMGSMIDAAIVVRSHTRYVACDS